MNNSTWCAPRFVTGGQKSKSQRAMDGVQEKRVREGPVVVVTLSAETSTPRRRTLSTSYEHVVTPLGELPRVRRMRLKAESSARSRAMVRLQPAKQAQHLADQKRKRDAAPKPARDARQQRVHAPLDSDWQRCEMERQLMEQEAAEAVEHDRRREAQRRRV